MPNDSGYVAQQAQAEDVAAIALAGLTAQRKTLPAMLFYDDEGCRLFYEITRLPEYYLTRTETALLQRIAPRSCRTVFATRPWWNLAAVTRQKLGFCWTNPKRRLTLM